MSSAKLLNGVARRLANDAEFLAFKGLTVSSGNEEKAVYIIKDSEAEKTPENVPLCLVYTITGSKDRQSPQFYNAKLVFECYAKDGNTARLMAERVMGIMKDWSPEGMVATGVTFAADATITTGKQGLKGHRVYYDVPYLVG